MEDATGRSVDSVTVSLSQNELAHLRGVAESLASSMGGHEHLPSDDHDLEITFVVEKHTSSAIGR